MANANTNYIDVRALSKVKNDLILKKYEQIPFKGTFELRDLKSFFGSKLLEIEDNIVIDDSNIQYYQVFTSGNTKNNGFQYYNQSSLETLFSTNLYNVKQNNHSLKLLQQNNIDLEKNARWEFNINLYAILSEYLFLKLKESRAFKSISHDILLNRNINKSIYEYIYYNLMSRYKFSRINLYVRYFSLFDYLVIDNNVKYKFKPKFDSTLVDPQYLVNNLNLKVNDYNTIDNIVINYNQIKPSNEYAWDYYFNIFFEKI